jgi:hypothetical protein
LQQRSPTNFRKDDALQTKLHIATTTPSIWQEENSSTKVNQLLQYSNMQDDKAFRERASPKLISLPSNTRVVNHLHIISNRPNLHHNVDLIDTRTISIQHFPLRSELKKERSPQFPSIETAS